MVGLVFVTRLVLSSVVRLWPSELFPRGVHGCVLQQRLNAHHHRRHMYWLMAKEEGKVARVGGGHRVGGDSDHTSQH